VYFEDVLLERLRNRLWQMNKDNKRRQEIKITPAVLGNDAGMIGSVIVE